MQPWPGCRLQPTECTARAQLVSSDATALYLTQSASVRSIRPARLTRCLARSNGEFSIAPQPRSSARLCVGSSLWRKSHSFCSRHATRQMIEREQRSAPPGASPMAGHAAKNCGQPDGRRTKQRLSYRTRSTGPLRAPRRSRQPPHTCTPTSSTPTSSSTRMALWSIRHRRSSSKRQATKALVTGLCSKAWRPPPRRSLRWFARCQDSPGADPAWPGCTRSSTRGSCADVELIPRGEGPPTRAEVPRGQVAVPPDYGPSLARRPEASLPRRTSPSRPLDSLIIAGRSLTRG